MSKNAVVSFAWKHLFDTLVDALMKRVPDVVQGKYGEAEALCKESKVIREKTLGPSHPDVAGIINQWASLLSSQVRRIPKGRVILYSGGSLSIVRISSPPHPFVFDLATCSARVRIIEQGKHDKVVPLCRRSLEILEKTLGPNHPDVSPTLTTMASAYYALVRGFAVVVSVAL